MGLFVLLSRDASHNTMGAHHINVDILTYTSSCASNLYHLKMTRHTPNTHYSVMTLRKFFNDTPISVESAKLWIRS